MSIVYSGDAYSLPMRKNVIVDVECVLWVVYYISTWGGQIIIVTLVFDNFEEKITKIFWGCLRHTNEEKRLFYWCVNSVCA